MAGRNVVYEEELVLCLQGCGYSTLTRVHMFLHDQVGDTLKVALKQQYCTVVCTHFVGIL